VSNILNDARYFKETFDFLMDSRRYTTESLRKYVGNIGSVLKELSLSKNSDHAYKAKDSLGKNFHPWEFTKFNLNFD
jgi:hypothetical protein